MKILFLGILIFSLVMFGYNIRRLISYIRIGKPEKRSDHPLERLRNVLVVALGHTKLFREPVAGLMHFFIFWGFLVLLFAILESIVQGIVADFSMSFLGPLYSPLGFLQDLFGLLVIGAIFVALYRRYISVPKRLEVDPHAKIDATIILVWILMIMLSMFGQSASYLAMRNDAGYESRFLSSALSLVFTHLSSEERELLYGSFWWVHMIFVLGFLNYLPYSKHLHIVSSIPNVYFAKREVRGTLKPLNLQDETVTKFGASDVEDLTWKQLLDGYACTECGRCTAACPAAMTGKPLSPRKVIVDIRQRLMEKGPLLSQRRGDDAGHPEGAGVPEGELLRRQLVDGYISENELWACTTCMACVQECPVQIEHVDAIVDMRRFLVLNESRFPREMQATFQNLERNFTPWAFSQSTRADWAEGLNIPRLAEKRDAGVLFWVGCAGAYDARYQRVARAFAKLMQIADVNFAILGTEEKCNGDPARRAGNEYLAQTLIMDNVTTMNKYGVKRIVTTCPHCFNIMKNEYPHFGGDYEVLHHSDVIMGFIKSGKLNLSKEQRATITYHDSCYLGRYNQRYESPRNILQSIPGATLVEMKRTRDKGLCCGAGGARMFMEETIGKRVNIERTEEALSLKPDVIGTACPFCMTMLTDGVKAKDAIEATQVKDIAELVLETIGGNSQKVE